MILFLTSSPCVQGADRAILTTENGFVDRLRAALPEHPQSLFVCADPHDHDRTDGFARDMRDAFAEAAMPFGGFCVLDGRNAEEARQLVEGSDFIILSGGHVPTQNAFFQKIGLRRWMQDFPGVVMGVSAGSMNAASLVYAQPELPGESVDLHYERWLPGLGLTDRMILPHYQMVRNSFLDGRRLFEEITYPDSMGHAFYALPDGSYLYADAEKELLLGEAYRICDGQMQPICPNGGQLLLEKSEKQIRPGR